MFAGALSPVHIIIVLAVVLIIFGPSKLPQLGESIGKTMKEIRKAQEPDTDAGHAGPEVSKSVGADDEE